MPSNPVTQDVHIDSALTELSIAYFQQPNNFIATRVFPNVPSDFRSNKFYEFDRGDFNRDEARLRAEGAESAGGGYKLSQGNFNCHVYAFHKDIGFQVEANSDTVLNQERAAVQFVSHKLLITRENLWADKFFTAGVWTTEYDGVPTSPGTGEKLQWNLQNSTPIEDIDDAIAAVLESTGYMPNKMVLGFRTYLALKNHPDIIDRVKFVQNISANETVTVNEANLANLFNLQEVLVGKSIKNTASEGQAAAHEFITGRHALLVYAAPSPSVEMPSAGYTFTWRRYLGSQDGSGLAFDRFEMRERKAIRVEGEIALDQKLISADLGVFFNGIVAA